MKKIIHPKLKNYNYYIITIKGNNETLKISNYELDTFIKKIKENKNGK